MKALIVALAGLLAACTLTHSSPSGPAPAPETGGVVLGTFDSRVLAIAYYRSEQFSLVQKARRSAHDAAGPEERQRIVAEMEALQQHVHRQGFGTAPIPEILALIEDQLPAIAQEAGVQAVCSKWDLVWSEPEIATVDLSLALAELFAPSEETRRMLPEVLKQPPVPAATLEQHGRDI